MLIRNNVRIVKKYKNTDNIDISKKEDIVLLLISRISGLTEPVLH